MSYIPYDNFRKEKVHYTFYRDFSTFNKFIDIDGERFEVVNNKVQSFLSFTPTPDKAHIGDKYYRALAYVYGELLPRTFKSFDEKALFLILSIDPELELLDIQNEESRLQNIKDRSRERFGIYDERLLFLERYYQKKYYPDKKFTF